jgi:hypothetical protein
VKDGGSQAAKDAERQHRADEEARAQRHLMMRNLSAQGSPPDRHRGGMAGCFPGGTLIATPSGPMPIDELSPGAWVLAFGDRATLVPRRILARRTYPGGRLWCIRLHTPIPSILATGRHPFLTVRGWVRADVLRPGDRLRMGDGRWQAIASVRKISASTPVYNLITEWDHTYVAGGVVVHNFARLRTLRVMWHRLLARLRGMRRTTRGPYLLMES